MYLKGNLPFAPDGSTSGYILMIITLSGMSEKTAVSGASSSRRALVLCVRRWSSVHRDLGLHLVQPIAALDQLYQSPRKPGRRRPVDHIVVEHHREVENLAWLDPAIHHRRLPGSTPYD
jgi:hypothetical protein